MNINQATRPLKSRPSPAPPAATAPPGQTPFGARFQRGLSAIGNTVFKPFAYIKTRVVAVNAGLHRLLAGLRKAKPTRSNAARRVNKDPNAVLKEMLTNPADRAIQPKYLLSSLTNDGYADVNGKAIVAYLKQNPTSPLFSSDNIRIVGDKIVFITPLPIPGVAQAVTELAIDTRDSKNGEFRGVFALNVLGDASLSFSHLADLCEQMSNNPDRNFAQMRLAYLVAGQMDDPSARVLLDMGYDGAIRQLVAFNETTRSYEPKFNYAALFQPTTWPRGKPDETAARTSLPASVTTGAKLSVRALRARFERQGGVMGAAPDRRRG
ncbi:hypothetical protein ACL2XP_22180 [Sodalis sp. RH21]|uniref:hypothetical protein n=1 Tax=unclassified Sodalis (in: enterobacteria) TaxID=2636512 RepID=UPI0039B6B13D